MSEKLIPLATWAANRYGEYAPSIYTLRRWVREAKILPAPKKHGRTYFVKESAQYLNYNDPAYDSTSTQ